uniref:Uncharacterized protein n=1 Tax=viral metagenome TaxID=1070528 RepID=A0A6C0AMN8_9ZZZZ
MSNEIGHWNNGTESVPKSVPKSGPDKAQLHPITAMAASGIDRHLSNRLNPDLSARIMKTLLKKNNTKAKRFAHGTATPALNILKRTSHIGKMNVTRRKLHVMKQEQKEEYERYLREIKDYEQAIKKEEAILEQDKKRLMKTAESILAMKALDALKKKRRHRNEARTKKARKHTK